MKSAPAEPDGVNPVDSQNQLIRWLRPGCGPLCDLECVCMSDWQKEHETTVAWGLHTHTHTGQGAVPGLLPCPAVMGLLSPPRTLSHTLSREIDSPEVPLPLICVCVRERVCLSIHLPVHQYITVLQLVSLAVKSSVRQESRWLPVSYQQSILLSFNTGHDRYPTQILEPIDNQGFSW